MPVDGSGGGGSVLAFVDCCGCVRAVVAIVFLPVLACKCLSLLVRPGLRAFAFWFVFRGWLHVGGTRAKERFMGIPSPVSSSYCCRFVFNFAFFAAHDFFLRAQHVF